MPLSQIERRPPPFFRQGPSALTKLLVFSAMAIFLMAADTRLKLTQPLRAVAATLLLPVQRALQATVGLADDVADYLRGYQAALSAANDARQQVLRQSVLLGRAEQLQAENDQLRALLALRPALQVRTLAAQVLYEAADPFSRKLFIDRGAVQGIRPGSPVVTAQGVLGQVTAVYPLSAEVTLLIDRSAAIPVLNRRTEQRAAAFGGADGGNALELRFLSANADVQVGDLLTTSGLDGVYPAHLVVGKVARVERRSDAGFARITVQPAAQADGVRQLLVLTPMADQLPPRPGADEPADRGESVRGLGAAVLGASSGAASGAASAPAPVPARAGSAAALPPSPASAAPVPSRPPLAIARPAAPGPAASVQAGPTEPTEPAAGASGGQP